jgi:hypothetical protein
MYRECKAQIENPLMYREKKGIPQLLKTIKAWTCWPVYGAQEFGCALVDQIVDGCLRMAVLVVALVILATYAIRVAVVLLVCHVLKTCSMGVSRKYIMTGCFL